MGGDTIACRVNRVHHGQTTFGRNLSTGCRESGDHAKISMLPGIDRESAGVFSPAVLGLILLAAGGGCDGTLPLPYPKLDAAAYDCPTGPHAPSCWDLQQREAAIERLEGREFQMDEPPGITCSLIHPSEDPIEFECGVLLIGIRAGVPRSEFARVEEVTGGTIVEFDDTAYGWGRLEIEPGTEVAAFRAIVFNPDLHWVNLNRTGPAVTN